MKTRNNELLNALLSNVDDILGYVYAGEDAELQGCCDKAFWSDGSDADRPVVDFPNARWQEIAYSLAIVYGRDFTSNRFLGDVRIAETIRRIFMYWTRLQHDDGSFDEWRKEEHGQPPTAFTLFAMTRAYALCSAVFNEDERGRILDSFSRSARFLLKNDELIATNHEVVSVAALYSASITDGLSDDLRRRIIPAISRKIGKIKNNFCFSEGWFKEIDGPDTGYNTVSLAYIALYWSLSGDSRVLDMIRKVIEFNTYFMCPDGLFGGGTNSRYAYINYPLGYALTVDTCPGACMLLSGFYDSLHQYIVGGKYRFGEYHKAVAVYLYLLTALSIDSCDRLETAVAPALTTTVFPEASILSYRGGDVCATVGWGAALGFLYIAQEGKTLIYTSPVGWLYQGGVTAETADSQIVSGTFRKNRLQHVIGAASYETSGYVVPFAPTVESRWQVRPNYKIKSAIFGMLRRVPLLIYCGRIVWFNLVKRFSDFVRFYFRPRYGFCRVVAFNGNRIMFDTQIENHRDLRRVMFQEFIYAPSAANSYRFNGIKLEPGKPLLIETAALDIDADGTAFRIDFGHPIKIAVSQLDQKESEKILAFANGALIRISFEPLRAQDLNMPYRLSYALSIGVQKAQGAVGTRPA